MASENSKCSSGKASLNRYYDDTPEHKAPRAIYDVPNWQRSVGSSQSPCGRSPSRKQCNRVISFGVIIVYRIIVAVQVKVVAQHMTVQAGVYIEEPSRFRIVIPTLQIIQFGLSIVVVPAVAEGVICPHDALLHRGRIGRRAEGKIPPGVIRIRTDFLSGGVIDSNNVTLQVLLKVVVSNVYVP